MFTFGHSKCKLLIKLIRIVIIKTIATTIMTITMTITMTKILSNPIARLIGIYFIWIICHYLAAHLYAYLCAPLNILGFVLSPFMVAAPHCQALRWTVYNGGLTITNMWALSGAWIISKLVL